MLRPAARLEGDVVGWANFDGGLLPFYLGRQRVCTGGRREGFWGQDLHASDRSRSGAIKAESCGDGDCRVRRTVCEGVCIGVWLWGREIVIHFLLASSWTGSIGSVAARLTEGSRSGNATLSDAHPFRGAALCEALLGEGATVDWRFSNGGDEAATTGQIGALGWAGLLGPYSHLAICLGIGPVILLWARSG
ncbi:hypothetical protein RchiOBHm_Chr2g0128651 [Rosa chinensis]|uniref:Uncharacterized protein n=1 Tax=Rosa chinensis TaxID=74649 RepID=A0A2P6RUE3_ROSCH|nr:hypothetical protein RchiOBHm_Chr2g0128651 [Rosa chinensis]